MSKLTLSDLTSLANEVTAVATLNNNWDLIIAAVENTLSRDGTTPNAMEADLDMNSNQILNLAVATTATEPVRFDQVQDMLPTVYVQNSAPVTTAIQGSLWIDADSADNDLYQIDSTVWTDTTINLKGDTGATGATGAAGADGIDGTHPGLRYLFDASTVMGDPGMGEVRFNDAVLANITSIAFSANSEAAGNPDISAFIATWDDVTNTTATGTLFVKKIGAPENFIVLQVTGVTDNTTWMEVTANTVESGGSFSAADELSFEFSYSGADGAGVGDVVGPASSTNSRFALFSGTTGKLLKEHTGVPGALAVKDTVAGTDIDDAAVTYAKIQDISATARILGRNTAGAGDVEEITEAQLKTLFNLEIGTDVEAFDADILRADVTDDLTVGYTATPFDHGTKTTGSYTPEPDLGPLQKVTNNGAHTITAPTKSGAFVLMITNAASAGAITFSGFEKQLSSDTYAVTDTLKYAVFIYGFNSVQFYMIRALQ